METTILRTSFCFTAETKRQLEVICSLYRENKSQAMTRCIQITYNSLKLPKELNENKPNAK